MSGRLALSLRNPTFAKVRGFVGFYDGTNGRLALSFAKPNICRGSGLCFVGFRKLQPNLRVYVFRQPNLQRTQPTRWVSFVYPTYREPNLRVKKSKFQKASLVNTKFIEADLSDANFKYADLSGADFSGAILHGANFEQVIIDKDTNFTGAKMGDKQRQQISKARASIK